MAQAIHSTSITQVQLDAALAPIMAMLMQLKSHAVLLPLSQPTAMVEQLPLWLPAQPINLSSHSPSLPSPLQAPNATSTHRNGQQSL
jgi:hypothetical protein